MPYTKEQIKQMLQTNDKAVARGVLAIYAYQTAVEQAGDVTFRMAVPFAQGRMAELPAQVSNIEVVKVRTKRC